MKLCQEVKDFAEIMAQKNKGTRLVVSQGQTDKASGMSQGQRDKARVYNVISDLYTFAMSQAPKHINPSPYHLSNNLSLPSISLSHTHSHTHSQACTCVHTHSN